MAKVLAAKLSELGSMKKVEVAGMDDIVVANVGGKIYAMRGVCNHQGRAALRGRAQRQCDNLPMARREVGRYHRKARGVPAAA